MYSTDAQEMKKTLEMGAEILSNRPELLSVALADLLDELDDGTSEMLHIRWGVAARTVIASLADFSPRTLIPALAKYEDRGLICEYVGYLLLSECNVDLDALLIEAEHMDQFDSVAPYVAPNLQYQAMPVCERLCEILAILNGHTGSRHYHPLINAYAERIKDVDDYRTIAAALADLSGRAQYDFMRAIRWAWFKNAPKEASEVIGKLLSYSGPWSKRAAIDFLETGLRYEKASFVDYYPQVEGLVQTEKELWLAAIPVFVQYLLAEGTDACDRLRAKMLDLLQGIPNGTLEEKCSLIESLQREERQSADLESIFQAVLRCSFDQDNTILGMLDTCFYFRLRRQADTWKSILQMLLTVFSANQYHRDYARFFEAFSSTTNQLREHQSVITAVALQYLLRGGEEELFFGLGLLSHIGNIPKMYQDRSSLPLDLPATLSCEQMIRIIKAVLYFSFDGQFICNTAFLLLDLSDQACTEYIQFCLDEVTGNYPGTMAKCAEQFHADGNRAQIALADQVLRKRQEAVTAYSIGRGIRDIYPRREHSVIYGQAQAELMRRTEEKNKGSSVLDHLFCKRILKYGDRMAFVAHGAKGELIYRVNSPVHLSHEMEMPCTGSQDPVRYAIERSRFLQEVRENETDTQGLSTSAQGEK